MGGQALTWTQWAPPGCGQVLVGREEALEGGGADVNWGPPVPVCGGPAMKGLDLAPPTGKGMQAGGEEALEVGGYVAHCGAPGAFVGAAGTHKARAAATDG